MSVAQNSKKGTSSAGSRHPKKEGITAKPWWPWLMRILKIAFFSIVAYLLFTQARSVEWDKVLTTMRERPLQGLLIAALLAAGSHLLYSCFDLLGRHITGHNLSARQVMTTSFISYAFNLNMGALIGGVGFRYRLYSRLGLETDTITRVVLMSMLTNWLGYLLLAGLLFSWSPIPPPPEWKIDIQGLHILGFVLLALAIGYILLCAFARKRTWTIRGHEITLPSLRLGLLQLSMSTLNWMLIGGVVFMLLEQKIAYPVVLGVLLVAAIAGVITHVPAGLGVIEVVFVALLSHEMPRTELLAALLAYRAIYYLVPLAVATVSYLMTEARAKGAGQGA